MGELREMIERNILGEAPAQRPKDGPQDPLAQAEQDLARAVRLRTLQSLSSGQLAPGKVEESTRIDLGGIFNSLTNLVTNTLEQVSTTRKSSQAGGEDPYLKHLEAELKQVQERLAAPGLDPISQMVAANQQFKMLMEAMRDQVGISQPAPASGPDMSYMLQLKRMELDAAERNRQWEEQMAERRREWQREDRRWQQEFRLREAEFEDSRATRKRAGSALENLAGSLLEGIDAERGEQGATVSASRKPKAFKCQECGQAVLVPSPEALEARCESCGASYDMVGQEA